MFLTKKFILSIVILFLFNFSLAALDIEMDGTRTVLSGQDCSIATYRFGTRSSFHGVPLDIIVEVLHEESSLTQGCVVLHNNIISTWITSNNNSAASIDLKFTLVKKGTRIPVKVDKFYVVNYDLDNFSTNNYQKFSGTDDVYYNDIDNIYVSEGSQVNTTKNHGFIFNFFNMFNMFNHNQKKIEYENKLKGQSIGNCLDTEAFAKPDCRAGVSFVNKSSFTSRAQNDRPYIILPDRVARDTRLIQFSFRVKDIAVLLPKQDFGDAPTEYPHVSHVISSNLFMGNHVPDNEEDQQSTINAMGDGEDDNDGVIVLPALTVGDKSYTVPVKVFNNSGKDAYITAWIDFNKNNIFEYEESLNTNSLKIPSSPSTQTVNITWDNITDAEVKAIENITEGNTMMRIRLSTSRVLRCDSAHYSTGAEYSDNYYTSPDGEIEDYQIEIQSPPKLSGKFNIERTNSGDFPIMSDERNAWYTQLVGRDFDYSLVFYDDDFTKEQNVSNVTVNIELIDEDSNASLYQYKLHIPDTVNTSRIDIIKTIPIKDLDKLPATKRAVFRVTYGVDAQGNLIQANCLEHPALCTNHRSDDAKDDFSIRPENFYISVADKDTIRKENNNSINNPLKVASGYEYNLTVIATSYPKNNYKAAKGYDANFTSDLEFKTVGTCADKTNGDVKINFKDGLFRDLTFTHDEVGEYLLKINDTTWTKVDNDDKQCILNKSTTTTDFNEPQGCNIEAISDINFSFYPYQFNLNFTMNNLPSSGHNDFIYMSQLNSIDNNVSLQLTGKITAQNKKSGTTTNFTKGCVAKDTQLLTNTNMLTDEGNGTTKIQTIIHPTTHLKDDVNITRMSLFNNKGLNLANYESIINMDAPLNIPSDRFLDENNGTLFLELRYNIEKHLSLPINPVQLTFQNLTANSVMASSTAEGMVAPDPYVPTGLQSLNNTIKNFYFSRVSPDQPNYPKVIFTNNPIVRTPLNIDIYCETSIAYCNETGVRGHTDLNGVSEAQVGWYISTDHHTTLDGEVQQLIPNLGTVKIAPKTNIKFLNGRNGVITDTFNVCNSTNDRVKVEIVPDTSLLYAPDSLDGHPFYFISCTDQNLSEISGIGKTGNIIGNKANANQTSKIDW